MKLNHIASQEFLFRNFSIFGHLSLTLTNLILFFGVHKPGHVDVAFFFSFFLFFLLFIIISLSLF